MSFQLCYNQCGREAGRDPLRQAVPEACVCVPPVVQRRCGQNRSEGKRLRKKRP